MKANTEDLKDTFKLGYERFEESRDKAALTWDLYHNRHYTTEQLAILEERGQPAETFNVIKLFARMLVGYYSTVVNTVKVMPRTHEDITSASLLNDVINFTFEDNRFDIEGDQIKLGAMISGLLISFTTVEDTGERDNFNRPINRIVTHHVPDYEVILDPDSKLDDYSDARFLHHYRWYREDSARALVGEEMLEKMQANYNFTDALEADIEYNYGVAFTGNYRTFDNYMIVHSVIEDDDGRRWSVLWHDDIVIKKTEITYRAVRWPFRVQRLHSSNEPEYYGIFNEVIQSQLALDQAVIKIQQMVNSQKVYVQEGSVQDVREFERMYNRVSGVIPVTSIAGLKFENLNAEVTEQYTIIDRSLDRIQRILGINDSFLGMAYASDSGRKVKLQQNASIMSLRYLSARIEAFYTSLGEDIGYLAQQFYYASQILDMTDEVTKTRFVSLNVPMQAPTGRMSPTGQPEMTPILVPELDPGSLEPMEDDEGNIILGPVSEEWSDISQTKFRVKVESTAYNDEDEKGQLMLESVMSGQIGVMMSQANPAGFFRMASLALKSQKTKYSPEISAILEQTAQMVVQGQASPNASAPVAASQPMSRQLKLPQNTNEEF